jgi:formylglycine-generating enzyme required for sulfatase activity
MKRTEVTWAEWNRIRDHAAEFGYIDIGPGQNGTYGDAGGSHPVTKVSWWDAIKWCNLRSELLGLTPVYLDRPGNNAAWAIRTGTPQVYVNGEGNGYRLPTEAEWEYACRAGTNTAFYTGPISTWLGRSENLDRAGWNYWNSGDATHPVALKEPNSFGLFDTHGNVFEWCWDWFGFYPAGPLTDPLGAGSGSDRVIRGGSWSTTPDQCRSASRASEPPDIAIDFMGFRAVRNGVP